MLHFVDSGFLKLDFTVTFIVDSQTHLPRSMIGRFTGEPQSMNFEFDYPATGPADIYALGVPKNAKLIDRAAAEAKKP